MSMYIFLPSHIDFVFYYHCKFFIQYVHTKINCETVPFYYDYVLKCTLIIVTVTSVLLLQGFDIAISFLE